MMIPLRKLSRHGLKMWLLLAALVLRSLVAPGFMLEASDDNPFGVTVTLCGGMNNIDAIEGLTSVEHAHANHVYDSTDTKQDDKHDPLSTHCATWSAGSAYMVSSFSGSNDLVYNPVNVILSVYSDPFTSNYSGNNHRSRAPPPVS